MVPFRLYGPWCFILLLLPALARGQEVNYDSLLQRVDTVENPVYKPVVSFSFGILNFHGDVKDGYNSTAIGNHGGAVNISTFVDRQHNFVANFNFMIGKLSGNEYSTTDLQRNLNFETELSSIGLNLEYRFGHFFPKESLVRPYVFIGLENISFSAKGDLEDSNGIPYNYWSDGTIRDLPETAPDAEQANIIHRDFVYETDLRLRERQEFGLGDYGQRSLAIPAGIGAHLRIDSRAFLSVGMSYHYALSDMLDNVAFTGTSIQGQKGNDGYIYSHLTLHFDLFSDPATRTVELLFAETEFDPLFFDDEDGDFVLDVSDRCPGTPYGVAVDSTGCPLDGDQDGIPDYLDKELNTARDAWVNEDGITVTDDEFLARIQQRNEAMERSDVEAYMSLIRGSYQIGTTVEIPEKFKPLDTDGDGYLSFEELLKTIDEYFDYQLELSLDELRQVNEFFFSQ